jgi:hypothetical protein
MLILWAYNIENIQYNFKHSYMLQLCTVCVMNAQPHSRSSRNKSKDIRMRKLPPVFMFEQWLVKLRGSSSLAS